MMKRIGSLAIHMCLMLGLSQRSAAIIFLQSADLAYHATTPGDNSGWQYEGKFIYYLGVPIGPYHFITAKHFGGTVGETFDFHGDIYTTIGFSETATTDLRIWEVNHAKPFPTYAPLYTGVGETGSTATVMGRGVPRDAALVVSSEPKGWLWAPSGDGFERWGRNVVAGNVFGGAVLGSLLAFTFDNPGIAGECTLGTGDSGGGVFILDSGLWKLAGLNYGAEGPFRLTPAGSDLSAALYDKGGLYYFNNTSWVQESNTPANKPASFYASRISSSVAWITTVTSVVATSLAPENFSAWQHLYFTPAEILTPEIAGPLADYDNDGTNNLLEFALNLDPTFNEQAVMTAATGIRGLPLVKLETISSGNKRLTIEFVRRTSGSGAGLTYSPEFSANLTSWAAGGTTTVTSLNSRWDRVKVVDTLPTTGNVKRFAHLKVER